MGNLKQSQFALSKEKKPTTTWERHPPQNPDEWPEYKSILKKKEVKIGLYVRTSSKNIFCFVWGPTF